MAAKRQRYEKFTKEQLLDELMKNIDMKDQFNVLNNKFDDLIKSHDKVMSELAEVKKDCSYMASKIIKLETNLLKCSQYHRKEILQVNPVPLSIGDNELEDIICKALSLSGTQVTKSDLQALHRTKKKEVVIIKFIERKKRDKILAQRSYLKDVKNELIELKLGPSLYITESLSNECSELFYKCRMLQKKNLLASTWFYNNAINIKVDQSSTPVKVYHKTHVEGCLKVVNIDDLICHILV